MFWFWVSFGLICFVLGGAGCLAVDCFVCIFLVYQLFVFFLFFFFLFFIPGALSPAPNIVGIILKVCEEERAQSEDCELCQLNTDTDIIQGVLAPNTTNFNYDNCYEREEKEIEIKGFEYGTDVPIITHNIILKYFEKEGEGGFSKGAHEPAPAITTGMGYDSGLFGHIIETPDGVLHTTHTSFIEGLFDGLFAPGIGVYFMTVCGFVAARIAAVLSIFNGLFGGLFGDTIAPHTGAHTTRNEEFIGSDIEAPGGAYATHNNGLIGGLIAVQMAVCLRTFNDFIKRLSCSHSGGTITTIIIRFLYCFNFGFTSAALTTTTVTGIENIIEGVSTGIEVEFEGVFDTPDIVFNEINKNEIIFDILEHKNKINVEILNEYNILKYYNVIFDFLSNNNGYYNEYPNTMIGHLVGGFNSSFGGYFIFFAVIFFFIIINNSQYSIFGIRLQSLFLLLLIFSKITIFTLFAVFILFTVLIVQQAITTIIIMSSVLSFVRGVFVQQEQAQEQELSQPPTQPPTPHSQSPQPEPEQPQQQISMEIPRKVDKTLSQRGEQLILGLEPTDPIKQRFILMGNQFNDLTYVAGRVRILQYKIKIQIPVLAMELAQQQQQPQLMIKYEEELLHYFIDKYAKNVTQRTLRYWLKDGKYFKEKETFLNINISNTNTSVDFCKKLIIVIENILKCEDLEVIDLNNNDNNTQFVENVLLFEKDYQRLKDERKNYVLTNEKDLINLLCKYYSLQCDFVKNFRNNEEARNIYLPFIKKMDTFIKKINKKFDSNGEDEQDFDMQIDLSQVFEQVLVFGNEINDNMNEHEKERLFNIYNNLVIQFVMYYNDNILFSTTLAICKTLKVCLLIMTIFTIFVIYFSYKRKTISKYS